MNEESDPELPAVDTRRRLAMRIMGVGGGGGFIAMLVGIFGGLPEVMYGGIGVALASYGVYYLMTRDR